MMYLTGGATSCAALGRGENWMHEHGPDELPGPVRGSRAWWQGMGEPPPSTAEGAPKPDKPKRKRKKSSKESTPMRMELVERIRKEIAAGTYDTQEKWDAALDRLLDRLDGD